MAANTDTSKICKNVQAVKDSLEEVEEMPVAARAVLGVGVERVDEGVAAGEVEAGAVETARVEWGAAVAEAHSPD